MDAQHIIVGVLMVAVVVVLLLGIILMMRGGELNRKYGNKLMVARVALQALLIGVILLLFATR